MTFFTFENSFILFIYQYKTPSLDLQIICNHKQIHLFTKYNNVFVNNEHRFGIWF